VIKKQKKKLKNTLKINLVDIKNSLIFVFINQTAMQKNNDINTGIGIGIGICVVILLFVLLLMKLFPLP